VLERHAKNSSYFDRQRHNCSLWRAWCGTLCAAICQKVYLSAARGTIVLWLPGVVAFVLRYAKKFIYRPLEAQLFSGVPGVVVVSLLRYAIKVHVSAARGAIVLWLPGVVAFVLGYAKKFTYRPLEVQLCGVPGVVVVYVLRYAKKVHVSASIEAQLCSGVSGVVASSLCC